MIGQTFYTLMLLSCLIALAWIDRKTLVLPNPLTLGLMLLAMVANFFGFGYCTFYTGLFGAMFGFGLIYGIDAIYYAVNKKRSIGMGDAKLLGALGAIFGLGTVVPLFFVAALGCLLLHLVQFRSFRPASVIAFGPYLCGAGMSFLMYQWWVLHR